MSTSAYQNINANKLAIILAALIGLIIMFNVPAIDLIGLHHEENIKLIADAVAIEIFNIISSEMFKL